MLQSMVSQRVGHDRATELNRATETLHDIWVYLYPSLSSTKMFMFIFPIYRGNMISMSSSIISN